MAVVVSTSGAPPKGAKADSTIREGRAGAPGGATAWLNQRNLLVACIETRRDDAMLGWRSPSRLSRTRC